MYQWGKHTYFPKLSEIHINRLKKLVDEFLNLDLSQMKTHILMADMQPVSEKHCEILQKLHHI